MRMAGQAGDHAALVKVETPDGGNDVCTLQTTLYKTQLQTRQMRHEQGGSKGWKDAMNHDLFKARLFKQSLLYRLMLSFRAEPTSNSWTCHSGRLLQSSRVRVRVKVRVNPNPNPNLKPKNGERTKQPTREKSPFRKSAKIYKKMQNKIQPHSKICKMPQNANKIHLHIYPPKNAVTGKKKVWQPAGT